MPELREDVLHAADIVDIVSKWVKLKKVGKNWTGLCPFHKEHTPSFTVAEDKQIFKCFGCGKGGNAITFLMEIERIDYRDALTMMARDYNIDVASYQRNPSDGSSQERQEKKNDIKTINTLSQEFFVRSFEDAHVAREYIYDKRKLTDEIVRRFGIGYAPESHYQLIEYLRSKGCDPQAMVQAGVAKEWNNGGDRYAFFRDRVTFPIKDQFGTIVGFGARALHPEQMPKYLNTTETPLYDKSKILFGLDLAKQHLNQVWHLFIVEWYMDVIAMHQYGLPVAIATCGTALTQQHIKVLQRHTQKLVFLFDSDAAWREATARALKLCFQADLFPLVFPLPAGYKDIDEFLTAQGKQMTIEDLAPSFQDAFQYCMESYASQYPPHLPGERKKLMTLLFDILVYINDYSMLLFYLEMMAKPFGVTADALLPQFKRYHIQQRNGISLWMWSSASWSWSSTWWGWSSGSRSTPWSASYQIDEETLLQALLHNDFWRSLDLDQPSQEQIAQLLGTVKDLFAILHITPGVPSASRDAQGVEQTAEMQQQLMEAQLWREQQMTTLAQTSKTHHLIHFVTAYIHKRSKVALGDKTLSSDQKQQILAISRRTAEKK